MRSLDECGQMRELIRVEPCYRQAAIPPESLPAGTILFFTRQKRSWGGFWLITDSLADRILLVPADRPPCIAPSDFDIRLDGLAARCALQVDLPREFVFRHGVLVGYVSSQMASAVRRRVELIEDGEIPIPHLGVAYATSFLLADEACTHIEERSKKSPLVSGASDLLLESSSVYEDYDADEHRV